MGQFSDRRLGSGEAGLGLSKGDRLGWFSMGSSIVLVFEAPRDFRFVVDPDRGCCGESRLGRQARARPQPANTASYVIRIATVVLFIYHIIMYCATYSQASTPAFVACGMKNGEHAVQRIKSCGVDSRNEATIPPQL